MNARAASVDRRWIIGCTILGAVLRLFRLGEQNLWIDELISLQMATYAEGAEFWRGLLADVHGPFTSVLLHGWARLGQSELWLRLLYAIPAIATVPLAWSLGRSLFDRRTARIACLAFAVSPFHVWYGQEARNYGWAILAIVAALVLFVRLWDGEGTRRTWLGLAVVLALGLLTNFSLTFLIFALTVLVLLRRPREGRFWLAWGGVLAFVGLVFLPWLVDWYGRIGGERIFVDAPPPMDVPLREAAGFSAAGVPYAFWAFCFGYTLGPSLLELHLDRSLHALGRHAPVLVAGFVVTLLPFALGLREAVRRRRGTLVLGLMLIPLALGIYLAARGVKTFHPRYLCAAFPVVVTLLAAGWTHGARLGRVTGAAALLLAAVALGQHYFSPAYAKEDSRSAARLILAEERPGDAVVVIYSWRPFEHYFARQGGGEAPIVHRHKRFLRTDAEIREHVAAVAADADRIWLVLCRWWDVAPEERIRAAFAESLRETGRWAYPGVTVTLHEPPGASS